MAGTRSSTRLREGAQTAKNPLKSISKAQSAAPGRPTRQTRGKAVAAEAQLSSSPPKHPGVQSQSHKDSIIARRGARRAVDDAKSLASIATVHQEGSEYSPSLHDRGDGEEPDDAIGAQLENDQKRPDEAFPLEQHSPKGNLMVESRQYLYVAAQDLYRHLCLEDRGQTWDGLLHTMRDVFNRWTENYPTGRKPFLDREHIDKTLGGRGAQVPAVAHIVSAANLVILLDFAHQVAADEEGLLRLFDTIDEDFPRCIMAPNSAIADSYEEHETFERALSIRISRWVLKILATKDCTPKVAMELGAPLIFVTDGDNAKFLSEEESGNIKFRPIYGVEFDDPDDQDEVRMRKDIWSKFDRVRQIILNHEGFDPERLREAASMKANVDELSQWAKGLFGEVMKTIEAESPRSRTGGQAEATEGLISRSLHNGINSLKALVRATETGQRTTSKNGSSGKRRLDEDTGQGNVYELPTSPPHKKPRSRVPRARTTQASESTRAEDADTEDAPRGTRGATERPPGSSGLGTSSQTQKPLQKRIPWDKHDEMVLQHWVGIHGSFWGHMEAMANGEKPGGELLLVKRTQQQFRDKARNMKLDMLRNDMILPKRFDYVRLGEKEKGLLRRLGKNFDRREDDVEDGRPVNTEYIPEDDD